MAERLPFSYVSVHNARGEVALRPLLPLSLQYGDQRRDVTGLLDTGADVNVLPFRLGLELGAIWESQQIASGFLATWRIMKREALFWMLPSRSYRA